MKDDNLTRQYELRFAGRNEYRNKVWKVLCHYFSTRFFPKDLTIMDLGCGWGEFINNVEAAKKFGMDLNRNAFEFLDPSVEFFHQSCSQAWPLPDDSLDTVFTSNFLEHLPDKVEVEKTLLEARRCLKPGGKLVCIGPNIRFLAGRYWDFWDHQIPISDRSLCEILRVQEFSIEHCIPGFLPYTMSTKRNAPVLFLKLYLRCSPAWPIFGRQFLVVAVKPAGR
jgi:SAM-dependent methyltransferase